VAVYLLFELRKIAELENPRHPHHSVPIVRHKATATLPLGALQLFLAKVSIDYPSIHPLSSITALGEHLVTTILPDTLVVRFIISGKKRSYHNHNSTERSPS